MKKLWIILLMLGCVLCLTSCGKVKTAKEEVIDYLEKYKSSDEAIMEELEQYVALDVFTEEQEELYKDILIKQYKSLEYEIISEIYDGKNCKILTRVKVINLSKAQREAATYLMNNSKEFIGIDGVYDKSRFLDYKLDMMSKSSEMIEYTIEFKLVNKNEKWEIVQLSNEDLEKIHGIYDYEE